MKLGLGSIGALHDLSKCEDFPYPITEEEAQFYCQEDGPLHTHGIYHGSKLVSIMTATFYRVFPCNDSPDGKVVCISGAYTHPDFRHKGYASMLLKEIEEDARAYGANYICLDSTADDFYKRNGFKHAPSNESRMWKRLTSTSA